MNAHGSARTRNNTRQINNVCAADKVPLNPPGSNRPARFVILPARAALKAVEKSCIEVKDALARVASSCDAHFKTWVSKWGQHEPAPIPIKNSAIQMIIIKLAELRFVGIRYKSVVIPMMPNIGAMITTFRTITGFAPALGTEPHVHPILIRAARYPATSGPNPCNSCKNNGRYNSAPLTAIDRITIIL